MLNRAAGRKHFVWVQKSEGFFIARSLQGPNLNLEHTADDRRAEDPRPQGSADGSAVRCSGLRGIVRHRILDVQA